MLLCPHRSTSQAAGDQLAISSRAVLESPFFDSSHCREHRVLAWFPFKKLAIIQSLGACKRTVLSVSSGRRFNRKPIQLITEKSRPLPRPAGYTGLPESTRTVGKTCPRAELLGFPHIPQEAEKNKEILLSNGCCYTDESPEFWRGLGNEWEAE